MTPIAHIRSPYGEKFGIPRQSNVVDGIESLIVFEPEFRMAEALRGIDGFDYLWLIWQFSDNVDAGWSPTVRPPRLGGNRRLGVFATRSPFRPNAMGLSSVRLLGVKYGTPDGPVLRVAGADLKDGTPILDIKPYLPYTDSHPGARGGFATEAPERKLTVVCPECLLAKFPEMQREPLCETLALDPRPSYHSDPNRVYGMKFLGFDVSFSVSEDGVLTVVDII
ncbi:MAG: tRNA (N6-threonylcarbamoyladenosine(37)-N6)-methyltransferase TrmO [Bacteroidales bacterium]|nr:tRNA (N6-threonylcarbamoyladenosine(37)-N6)-methyltransferase TrmO [Bacteroidales bacterium]